MSTVKLLAYDEMSDEARSVIDDIRSTRNIDEVNNFWKALANDPATLRRIWESLKLVMGPGHLDPLAKEMIYVAVSAANGCDYCLHSHTAAARAKGMSTEQHSELLAVVAMAHQTNALATSMAVPVDTQLLVNRETSTSSPD